MAIHCNTRRDTVLGSCRRKISSGPFIYVDSVLETSQVRPTLTRLLIVSVSHVHADITLHNQALHCFAPVVTLALVVATN
jgi:hypothetical protein